MKKQKLLGVFVLGAGLLAGQTPPPPPAPVNAPTSTATGSISQFNYGPDGRVEGFVMSPNTLVPLPPEWAVQVEMVARTGNQVKVTGAVMPTASGMQVMQPQSVEIAGKTLTAVPPAQPSPYTGSGVIRSLNYGGQGEVNGFVLQNGILARTPPFGASYLSVVKPGANIAISGFARVTPSGRTVVEVQSISVNGQTIAMNTAPAAGPPGGPRPDRGPARGLRGAAPAPPPPPAL